MTMRKNGLMFVVLFLMMLVQSCEEPYFGADDASESKGNLRVRVFEIDQTPFESLTHESTTRGEQAASEVCKRLNFAIYDMEGTRVKQVNQTSDDKGFGTASFQLEEGDYYVVVVGHSSNGNPTMTNPMKIQFNNSLGYSDTYLCSDYVSIAEEPEEFEVSLDRIVSLCRFVVTDEFPAEVKKMQFYYTGGSGAFDATTGLGCVNSKQDVKFDVVEGQNQFDLYTFLHDAEGTIHLKVTGLDALGNELHFREFDVPMQQNHITWLSGAFFDGTGSSAMTFTGVTVNTDWEGETYLTF